MKLTTAVLQDIAVIQKLAQEIWFIHYPPIIGYKQVNYMLDAMYSEKSLQKQMEQENHVFYLINIKNKNIGFVSIKQESKNAIFINKFYILKNKSNKGVGTQVFKMLLKIYKPKTIRLTVNRQNYQAINFYFKNGFMIEKVADFDIGNGYYMNDFVMVWQRANKTRSKA